MVLLFFVRGVENSKNKSEPEILRCMGKQCMHLFVGDPVYDSYVSGFVSVRAIGI